MVNADITARRRALKLTQKEAAARCGISQQHLSMIESGRTRPTLETLQRIVESLGLELHVRLRAGTALIAPDLPGSDLVARGIADLSRGMVSMPALLVSIGAPRLRRAGIPVPEPLARPNERLYELLSRDGADSAHSRYNALVRRLVSFERAAACAS